MISSQKSPKNLTSLTGLRFLAAFFIFITHGANLFDLKDAALQKNYSYYAENLGIIGVSAFFILSGFVLTWSSKPGQRARTFWRRRFFKVFPNHVAVFLIALLLLIVAGDKVGLKPILTQLFLVQAWVPDQTVFLPPVNGITWSLSAELLFYALFPVLIVLVKKIRSERLWLSVGVLTAVALLLPIIAQVALSGHPASIQSATVSWPRQWFLYFFPVTRSLEFMIGMVFAEIVRRNKWVNIGILPAGVLVIASYALSFMLPPTYSFGQLFMLPTALLITALAVADINGRHNFLAGRTWNYLGEITYGFFLVHILVMFYIQAAISGQWGGTGYYTRQQWSTPVAALFLIGLFAVSLVLAAALYRFVQVPASNRWSKKRPVLTPTPNVPTETRPPVGNRS
jgi:peptidoglycan/LPS O-acetylase OafA/YrhL